LNRRPGSNAALAAVEKAITTFSTYVGYDKGIHHWIAEAKNEINQDVKVENAKPDRLWITTLVRVAVH
jgi:hypothetical protein